MIPPASTHTATSAPSARLGFLMASLPFVPRTPTRSTIGESAPPEQGDIVAHVKRLLTDAWVVTLDGSEREFPRGWVLLENGLVSGCGDGPAPEADEVVRLDGAVVTPGLVNTHHHLYQTLTRARAQQADLFTWLRELYPVWAG